MSRERDLRLDLAELLRTHAAGPGADLRALFADPRRAERWSVEIGGCWVDLAKQALNDDLVAAAAELAGRLRLHEALEQLFAGEIVNASEGRAALHTLLRMPPQAAIPAGLVQHHAGIQATLSQMEALAGRLADAGIEVLVNLGIGGSDLGPRLVYEALAAEALPGRRLRFVANVDGNALEAVLRHLDPRRSAFVLASKSFGTQETRMNALSAIAWMRAHGLDKEEVAQRLVAVTARPAAATTFGVPPEHVLGFDEAIGGRYSVWSAIGFPLVYAFGVERFRALLDGAHAVDQHVRTAPWERNLGFLLALVDLLHRCGFGHPSHAVVVYDERLARLPEYLQQLEMESNGKSVDAHGTPLPFPSAPVVWGGVGTSVQHAFFQALHQGTDVVPVSFVAAAHVEHSLPAHHDALIANMAAQAAALLRGRSYAEALAQERDAADPAAIARARQRVFAGNRPSTTILLDRVEPRTLGTLIALMEHKVYLAGRLLGINSFDQWGVELGKEICGELLPWVAGGAPVAGFDSSTAALVERYRAARSR
ncbi:MAG: glucose-6-phosphate isomerase [Xanthomonadales bacterium]|nr:Glucose-6-phosphate isomerase [Xanthomonadales bacterium]MCC6592844.1 glucose-6-phosphate isomerase [Xanthomonadales bacterium]MCE7930530.1 glucose-6-phosphate isomerase [Xanthomonadales bacterium PRO6]